MPRDLIIGTAGHIDHGKTALVKALTGTDCDRLPEEKQRGITIDIGFAHLDLGEVRLGVVDVPGHERFVRNMLAGATGFDLALLVVAADDGVMPQTREHFDILKLLGLRHGVVALTKADLVDEMTRELRILEIRELVAGSFLADAPIVPTSARAGTGIDELKRVIASAAERAATERGREWFRLCIDRAFVVQGHGTVVTGSVISGSVSVGEELEWRPRGERVRVRSLNHHGRSVEEAHRGQRAALNLAGVPLDAVERGQELATPGYLVPSKVLTVRLHVPAGGRRGVKHRLPLRVHLGTAETMATLSLLDSDAVEPGQWGLGQLFLDDALCATWGQPFIVRDSSAEHTLGGGQVLQPTPVKLRRRHIESIERIEKLCSDNAKVRATVVAWFAGFDGFGVADLVRGAGLLPDDAEAMLRTLVAEGAVADVGATKLHADRAGELAGRVMAVLAELHEKHPLMTSHDRMKVQSFLDYVDRPAVVAGVVDQLIRKRELVGDLKRLARADFKPKLSVNQRKLKDRIVAAVLAGGFTPPDVASFQSEPGSANLRELFEVSMAEGFLVQVSPEIYLHADVEAKMRSMVAERLAGGVGATVAEIRDLLGTTRKYAVPICEYLDRVGVTRREGDVRVLGERETSAPRSPN